MQGYIENQLKQFTLSDYKTVWLSQQVQKKGWQNSTYIHDENSKQIRLEGNNLIKGPVPKPTTIWYLIAHVPNSVLST